MSMEDICYVVRLEPGEDVKLSIQNFAKDKNIEAGWIVTCVGSLTSYAIRFANQQQAAVKNGFFEIVSLTGTLSINGSHIHISIADENGKLIGGHLMEGCIVYTTAEIVVAKSNNYIFKREDDQNTQWKELQIIKQ